MKLKGSCPECGHEGSFEVIQILLQIERVVEAATQCEKCLKTFVVAFLVTVSNEPITTNGNISHDNKPPQHTNDYYD